VFGKSTDETIAEFLERKVYWGTRLSTQYPIAGTQGAAFKVWVGDPTDAQYLETTAAHLIEIAGRAVAGDGLVRLDGEYAVATAGLMGQAERFEGAMRSAVEELEKKHAFERG
jgi:hypothetical protein